MDQESDGGESMAAGAWSIHEAEEQNDRAQSSVDMHVQNKLELS